MKIYDPNKAELWIDGERVTTLREVSYGGEPAEVERDDTMSPARGWNRHERRRAAALARRAAR